MQFPPTQVDTAVCLSSVLHLALSHFLLILHSALWNNQFSHSKHNNTEVKLEKPQLLKILTLMGLFWVCFSSRRVKKNLCFQKEELWYFLLTDHPGDCRLGQYHTRYGDRFQFCFWFIINLCKQVDVIFICFIFLLKYDYIISLYSISFLQLLPLCSEPFFVDIFLIILFFTSV